MLHQSHAFQNNLTHPLSNPNSIVINVLEGKDILIRLVNTYNPPNLKPPHPIITPPDHRRTTLIYLTDHDIDERYPTVIVRDFNTHAKQWSLPGATFSLWATRLCDWIDNHGFSLLNLLLTPTRRATRDDEHDSVLDLIFTNEAALWIGHVGLVEISEVESLGSDHAALLFSILPSDHPSHIPSPSPAGY